MPKIQMAGISQQLALEEPDISAEYSTVDRENQENRIMDSSLETPIVQSNLSPAQFVERMEPLLMQQEARYSLMLGLALNIARQPDFYGTDPPYLAIAEDTKGVAAAALMTPPRGIITYSNRAESRPGLTAIANDLAGAGWSLPSVNGPEPICTEFASIWTELTQVKSEIAVSERLFELREVIHPTYSSGQLRLATDEDMELLPHWFVAFVEEALYLVETISLDEARADVQRRVERGSLYVWEDGEPVCMFGTGRVTQHGISIGPVYTPPNMRGKGYATSGVARLSQLLLDQGRSFCTLFTDLANPTSNRIYQNVGYRPICDYTVYRFLNA
jgi:predicted GNAT family acetyltransferase